MEKIIKDCIYGHITLPSLSISFLDTPEFQRLRRVRQLGMAHYAFPSATHTRFEHSIGTCYLAGKMVDQLIRFVKKQSHPLPYSIDQLSNPRTKDLIQLAALYHDIGHFAYSHMFDTFLSNVVFTQEVPHIFKLHEHEDRSVYFLRKVNARLNLLSPDEENFVANCILGQVPPDSPPYLFEIVSSEIDADRLDYLNRDSYHCGMPGFQPEYIILNMGINSEGHIAFKEKARLDIQDLFATRFRMYKNVYQHHTSLKIDKIYFCAMKQLGQRLLVFGEKTDDFNIETLIRSSPMLEYLLFELETRQLEHSCPNCQDYNPTHATKNAKMDLVPFF